MPEVKFMTWREDIFDEGGDLIKEKALCLHASLGMVDYHCILWDETDQELEDSKALLTEAILARIARIQRGYNEIW